MEQMSLHKIISVWLLTALAWITTLTNLELVIKIAAGLVALGYASWRWIRDVRNDRRKK